MVCLKRLRVQSMHACRLFLVMPLLRCQHGHLPGLRDRLSHSADQNVEEHGRTHRRMTTPRTRGGLVLLMSHVDGCRRTLFNAMSGYLRTNWSHDIQICTRTNLEANRLILL